MLAGFLVFVILGIALIVSLIIVAIGVVCLCRSVSAQFNFDANYNLFEFVCDIYDFFPPHWYLVH